MNFIPYPVDAAIIGVFLVVNLILGLFHSRGVKTLRDYALGGKNFSTVTLVATTVATCISGSVLFIVVQNTYLSGLYFLVAVVGLPLNTFLSGMLAPKMKEFINKLSVADVMGSIYGGIVRTLIALGTILAKTGFIAMQFKVIAGAFSSVFNLPSTQSTCIAATIVITYSALGGIRAVTFTDMLQFLTFGVVLPVLALSVWKNLSEDTSPLEIIRKHPNFNIDQVVRWTPEFGTTLSLLVYFTFPTVYTPEIFQRMAMARDVRQAKKMLVYASGVMLAMILLMAWIGVLILADKPGMTTAEVMPYIFQKHAYVGLRGLLGLGVVALAMSTADSLLNACSVTFSNDLFRPLKGQPQGSVMAAKVFSLTLGVTALGLALYSKDMLSLIMFAGSFYVPLFAVPVLMTMLGFRTSSRVVIVSMVAGFGTMVLWSYIYTNKSSTLPGLIGSFIALISSHYLLREPGGWVGGDQDKGLSRARSHQKWARLWHKIQTFKLWPYLEKNLPRQEGMYVLFGFYTMAAVYMSFYTLDPVQIRLYEPTYHWLYKVALCISSVFFTFPVWPERMKGRRFMALFWPLGLGTLLFFIGTLLAIINQFHHLQVMIMVLNLLVSTLLMRWPLVLVVSVLGPLCAVLFALKGMQAPLFVCSMGSIPMQLMYGLLFFSSFLIVVFRGKALYQQLQSQHALLTDAHQASKDILLESFKEKIAILRTLRSAQVGAMSDLVTLARNTKTTWPKGTQVPDALLQLEERLTTMSVKLECIESKAIDYLQLNTDQVFLQPLLDEVQDSAYTLYPECVVREDVDSRHIAFTCDPKYIKEMLLNACKLFGSAPAVWLGVRDTQLTCTLDTPRSGYVKRTPALCFFISSLEQAPQIDAQYPMQTHFAGEIVVPNSESELTLMRNQQIVRAHYGCSMQSESTHLYVVPVNIRYLRTPDMDRVHMRLGVDLVRADDTYPGAKEAEENLMQAVRQHPHISVERVRSAIEVIKWYHGSMRRATKEPFYLHPVEVARIVLTFNTEETTLLGALLHDTVEDTPMLLENVRAMFGEDVAQVVRGVTHMATGKGGFQKVKLASHENILLLLEETDPRVLYVKIADRLHNMRTIHGKKPQKQHTTAQETLQFFVPLAIKMNWPDAAEELKKRSLEVLSSEVSSDFV